MFIVVRFLSFFFVYLCHGGLCHLLLLVPAPLNVLVYICIMSIVSILHNYVCLLEHANICHKLGFG